MACETQGNYPQTYDSIRLPIGNQAADVLPSALLSAVMFAAVWCLQYLGLSPVLTLLVQIPAGVAVYVLGSALFRIESFGYLLGLVRESLTRRRQGPAQT